MKNLIPKTALLLLALTVTAYAQSYSINWFKVAGGGGTSTGGGYTMSGTIGQQDAGAMSGGGYSLSGGFWSLEAVQTAGAPTLLITVTGTKAILSWSATASGYLLENNHSLMVTNGWSVVSPAPVTTNGFNYVTNTIAPGNNFYRLHHP